MGTPYRLPQEGLGGGRGHLSRASRKEACRKDPYRKDCPCRKDFPCRKVFPYTSLTALPQALTINIYVHTSRLDGQLEQFKLT